MIELLIFFIIDVFFINLRIIRSVDSAPRVDADEPLKIKYVNFLCRDLKYGSVFSKQRHAIGRLFKELYKVLIQKAVTNQVAYGKAWDNKEIATFQPEFLFEMRDFSCATGDIINAMIWT